MKVTSTKILVFLTIILVLLNIDYNHLNWKDILTLLLVGAAIITEFVYRKNKN